MSKINSKDLIVNRLLESTKPLACHELKIVGYSENTIATRLSELAKDQIIIGRQRKGYLYKEWYINPQVLAEEALNVNN